MNSYRRQIIGAGCLAVLFALLLPPAPAGADGGKPIPVSCLYLHASAVDGSAAKRGGGAEVSEAGFYPALQESGPSESPDTLAAVVVLIDWEDHQSHPSLYPPSRFERVFFHETPNGDETVRDYFLENSNDIFRLGGIVTVWLRSSLPYGHYVDGNYGFDVSDEAFEAEPYAANVWGIVREAVELADEAGVDFTDFDLDEDGVVDAVIVVHAGRGAEAALGPSSPDQIWSHKSDMTDPYITARLGYTEVDGVRIGAYTMNPEIGEAGVYAHELGHVLGLPDLYRTFEDDGRTVQQTSIGTYCLMDAGSLLPYQPTDGVRAGASPGHLNPFFKSWLGWVVPEAYERDGAGDTVVAVRLEQIERGGVPARLGENPNGIDWDGEGGGTGEYFLLESRDNVGFDAFLPGEGMLIWQVNERRPANESSSIDKRLLVVFEAADGVPGNIDDPGNPGYLGEQRDFWPYGTKNDWTPETDPSSDILFGRFTGITVTDIRKSGGVIDFDLRFQEVPAGGLSVFPNPFRPGTDEYMKFAFPAEGAPSVRIYDLGGKLVRTLDEVGSEVRESPEGWVAEWAGKNDSGKEIASGVYLYVIYGAGDAKSGKIAVLR